MDLDLDLDFFGGRNSIFGTVCSQHHVSTTIVRQFSVWNFSAVAQSVFDWYLTKTIIMKGPLNNQIISLIPILLATIISSPELQWSRSSPALVDALPIRSETVVTDLLSDLFRQTIYTRIENLLLDPGRKSQEKQKIIDSAVDNYHKQKMIMPEDQEAPSTLADLTGKLQKCDIF